MLHIRLLGDFQLKWHDQEIPLIQGRLQSLLAYLLLHRGVVQSRQRVAFLRWPDTSETRAHAYLRRDLHDLRHALPMPETFLIVTRQTIQWRRDVPVMLDVDDFRKALADADLALSQGQAGVAAGMLKEAVALFEGRLLPGCYEEWIEPERARLDEEFTSALVQLSTIAENQGAYVDAIGSARRLLRHDPISEINYQRLMRLHALNQDRAGALRVYQECVETLQRELNVTPEPETERFYKHLLAQENAVPVTLQPQPGLIALVGRYEVWRQLTAAWQETVRGRAQLLLLTGEAGVGKTRLAEELLAWVAQQGFAAAHTRLYAVEGNLAYAPVIAWLRSDALRARWETLGPGWLSEVARLLPELLTEQPTLPHPEPLAEQWQRQRLFDALAHAFLADEGPLLLLIDDLQWCDGETLAWLHYLLRQELRASILIVGTVRMEEIAVIDHRVRTLITALRATEQVRELEISALDEEATTQLAATLIGRTPDPTWAARLYDFTQGNPLFVVEMIRASIEEGAQSNDGLPWNTTLPRKIQAVIQARLDRLSAAARELAALAAAVGRSFTLPLLVAASRNGEEAVVAALDELWQRRFVREEEAGIYAFGHERLVETIYSEISPIRRQTIHHHIAQALEQIHQEAPETVAAQLAFHYARAMLIQQAVRWYRRAAAEEREIYASANAATYMRSGLALLERMPQTDGRKLLELKMLQELANDLRLITILSDPQLLPIWGRAYALAQEVGDIHHLFMATLRYGTYLRVRGNKAQARLLVEQLLQIAEKTQNPMYQAEAYFENARIYEHLGNFVPALEWLSRAVALYTPANALAWRRLSTDNMPFRIPRATFVGNLALVLWTLGYLQQAIRQLEEAVAEIEHVQRPAHITTALHVMMHVYRVLHDVASVQALAARIAELGTRFDFPFAAHVAPPFLGWLKGERGDPLEGIELMLHGIRFFRRWEMSLLYTFHLAMLAEAYLQVSDLAAAAATIDEALTVSVTREEHLWDAELFRLQGHILQAQDAPVSVAENSYQKALMIAREQQARSLELRAAMSLARLWQAEKQPQRAHELLASIYNWFAEGQSTSDLIEAQKLLKQIQASISS